MGKIWDRFCEAFDIETGPVEQRGLRLDPNGRIGHPEGLDGCDPNGRVGPVGRSAAEGTIENLKLQAMGLESHIEHLSKTLAMVRAGRDELHRLVTEGQGDNELQRRATEASEVDEVLRAAGPLDMGLTLAGRVAQVIEQRDLARSEARRYAARLGQVT